MSTLHKLHRYLLFHIDTTTLDARLLTLYSRKWVQWGLEWGPLCASLSDRLQEPLPACHRGSGDHRSGGQHPHPPLLPLCGYLQSENQEEVWADPTNLYETANIPAHLPPQHLWPALLSGGAPHLLVILFKIPMMMKFHWRLIYSYGYFPLSENFCIYGAFLRNAIGLFNLSFVYYFVFAFFNSLQHMQISTHWQL